MIKLYRLENPPPDGGPWVAANEGGWVPGSFETAGEAARAAASEHDQAAAAAEPGPPVKVSYPCTECGQPLTEDRAIYGYNCPEHALEPLANLVEELLSQFTMHGHPGRSSVRTPWIDRSRVDAWNECFRQLDPRR